MAGRQASTEEWTPTSTINSVLRHYGKFDESNNPSIMREGENYWMSQGTPKNRKFKLRKTGWEAAANLVKSINES